MFYGKITLQLISSVVKMFVVKTLTVKTFVSKMLVGKILEARCECVCITPQTQIYLFVIAGYVVTDVLPSNGTPSLSHKRNKIN